MNDIQVLDIVINFWFIFNISGILFIFRIYYIIVVVGDKFIVYSGGYSGFDFVGDRQVYCFDVKIFSWFIFLIKGDFLKFRYGYVMVVVGNRLFIYGGMVGFVFYDDFYFMDFDKMSWFNIRRKKVILLVRVVYSGVVVGKDIYIFGGMSREGVLDDLYKCDTCKCKNVFFVEFN